ncbi:MAG: hypothetical protein EOO50_07500 [Flavobacterium sp.]|uniref:hypothetical protein n=1 Tax=Flavobacterium sp. TaxID=239 RepID=UPI0012225ACC|nr:hypothetical protein [Flavobacterium sp.]RZJ67099.1 MAG: hypothetical protein EOO50_07500 [Flavobacterium sp.]
MSAKKILLLSSAIVVAVVCVGFLGLRTFTRKIVNNRDCEWANIDHVEIRAMADIPPTLASDCNYDAGKKRKTTVFALDTSKFDMDEYSSRHDFRKVSSAPENFADFDKDGIASVDTSELFYRDGKTQTNSYKMLLDARSGRIWVDLRYFYED